MATIVIGRKELFSFAERHSARRLTDYSGLADGAVLCCLFNLVFPDFRVRPAPPQTYSATQRARRNWELLFRRFARLCIPLSFLQPCALERSDVECGFSTLVLFYFLHHLSKKADYSSEFALDVSDSVMQYLQSTDCIASLLLGNALDWSAVPQALSAALRDGPGFHRSDAETAAAEEAAAALYRATYTRRGQRRASQTASTRSRSVSSERAGEVVESRTTRLSVGGPASKHMEERCGHGAAAAAASSSSSSEASFRQPSLSCGGTTSHDCGSSPPPRAPAPRTDKQAPATAATGAVAAHRRQADRKRTQYSSPSSTPASASYAASSSFSSSADARIDDGTLDTSLETRTATWSGDVSADVSRRLLPTDAHRDARRSTSASSQSRAASTGSSSRGTTRLTTHDDDDDDDSAASSRVEHRQRNPGSLSSTSAAAAAGPRVYFTAYRAASSVNQHLPAPSGRSEAMTAATSTEALPSRNAQEARLRAALEAKAEECESLQLRVAQLLSLLANVKTTAMSGEAARGASAQQEQMKHRIEELEAVVDAYECHAHTPPSAAAAAATATPHITSCDLEAEITALTADIVEEETGAPIDVNTAANLLHCLLLEYLQDSPRNCAQMQQWLWSIVAAHHTLEGRLLAAVGLLRTCAAKSGRGGVEQSPSALPSPGSEVEGFKQRSLSTVAAPVLRDASSSSFWTSSRASPVKGATALFDPSPPDNAVHDAVAQLRTSFYSELEQLHTREHELTEALHAAEDARRATVQRAVWRERQWRQLCAEVYAAEQASFRMADSETTDGVEACLRERATRYESVEALTQQLVAESEKTEKEKGKVGGGGAVGTPPADVDYARQRTSSCASLHTLVSHLQAEREQLLRDVAQLHDIVASLQTVVKGRTADLPPPPAFRPLFFPAETTTDCGRDIRSGSGKGDARVPPPPRGLSSLLRDDASPQFVL